MNVHQTNTSLSPERPRPTVKARDRVMTPDGIGTVQSVATLDGSVNVSLDAGGTKSFHVADVADLDAVTKALDGIAHDATAVGWCVHAALASALVLMTPAQRERWNTHGYAGALTAGEDEPVKKELCRRISAALRGA